MVRDELTVTPKAGGMGIGVLPHAFPVFMESRSAIYVPRVYGLQKFGQPSILDLVRGAECPTLREFRGELREGQLGAVRAFMEAANDPALRGGIVSLPCGGGKTVIALNVISLIARRTIIIAAKDFLLNQWRDRISEFIPSASVGFLKAQVCDVEGRDIVLASLQSLAIKVYPTHLFTDFDMCIFDECHHLAAETFSRALPKVATPICMGLSATLDRRDGLRRVFEWFLGPVAYEAPRQSRSDVQIKLLTIVDPTNPSYGKERLLYGGRVNMARMLTDICAHGSRTDTMLEALLACTKAEPGRRILILTDRRSHAEDLSRGLGKRGVHPTDVGMYLGGMKSSDLKASESCSFIIGTFAMAAEGFDVPALDTLLLASPVSSIEQAIGRIGRTLVESRMYPPLVIDIVDDFSVFRNQARRRKRFYVSKGYAISEILIPSHTKVASNREEAFKEEYEHDT